MFDARRCDGMGGGSFLGCGLTDRSSRRCYLTHKLVYEQGSTITLYATRPRPTTVAHRMVTCAVNGRNLVGCEQSKCVCTKEVGEMVALLQLIAMVPH